MTKSFKRNPHKKEEFLRKLKPLIIRSIRKYYNDFSQYEDLLQHGYEVILKGIDEFDEKKDVNFLWFIKMKLKFYYLDKHKYRRKKPSSLNKPIGEDEDEILDLIPYMDKSPLDKVLEKEKSMPEKSNSSINPKAKKNNHLLLYEKQKHKRNIVYLKDILQNSDKH